MNWRDRVSVTVEVGQRGTAAGDMVWDVSLWDAGSWSDLEPSFTALDGWSIESVSTRRGRDVWPRRYPSGTAEVVLVFDTPAGNWSLRPSSPVSLGQELRITAHVFDADGTPASDALPIYRGAIRKLADGWLPNQAGQMIFRITAYLTDRFADLAAVDLPEAASAVGLGDLSNARVVRVMDLAGIDAYYFADQGADVEHQSSTFARNLLDEAQVTAEGENGELYVDRAGFITLRPSYGGAFTPTRESTVQLTWSNVGGDEYLPDDYASIGPTGFGTGQDLDDVVNQVSLARSGGTAYTVSDTDSILRYGLRTNQRFDLTCRFDADVEAAADYRLEQLKDRTQRIDQISAVLSPRTLSARLVELIDIELQDRQRIEWSDGAATLAGEFLVQGIDHRISGAAWSLTARLWARAGEGLEPIAAGGLWSEALWSVDTWG